MPILFHLFRLIPEDRKAGVLLLALLASSLTVTSMKYSFNLLKSFRMILHPAKVSRFLK